MCLYDRRQNEKHEVTSFLFPRKSALRKSVNRELSHSVPFLKRRADGFAIARVEFHDICLVCMYVVHTVANLSDT